MNYLKLKLDMYSDHAWNMDYHNTSIQKHMYV